MVHKSMMRLQTTRGRADMEGVRLGFPESLVHFPNPLSPFPKATEPHHRLELAQVMHACIPALAT